jgi:PAS domain S-box-containing protein
VLLGRSLTRPLLDLHTAVRDFDISNDGQLRPVAVKGHDEIAELANTINSMVLGIQERSASLNRTNNRIQTYIQTVQTALLAIGNGGEITLLNVAGCRLLGFAPAGWLGRNWIADFVVDEEARRQLSAALAQGLPSGPGSAGIDAAAMLEYRVRSQDGQVLLMRWHNCLLRGETGQVLGMLCSGEDITRSRSQELELIEARKVALKALEIRRFEKAQETRQKIIDAAVRQLAAKSNKDQAILEKQVAEGQEKMERIQREKEERFRKNQEDCHISRQEMIANKRRLEEESWALEDKMVKMSLEANQREIEKEEEKVRLQHENTLKLKKIQYQEGLLANRRKVEARIIELEQAKILQSMGNQDDDKFAEICRAEIARYAAEGKPVYTLMRALETTQPALLPAKKPDKPVNPKKKRDE